MSQLITVLLLFVSGYLLIRVRRAEKSLALVEQEVIELLIDPVTGLYRRSKRTEDEIKNHILEAGRNHWSAVVLVLDLDKLKIVNDTFGHEAGDNLLKQVATLMQSCLRKYDLIYRWGGDEFVIVITFDSKGQDPLAAARILKDRIFKCTSYKQTKQGKYPISISSGLALIKNRDFNAAFKDADAEMYKEKKEKKRNSES